jgi:hypothetical protein
MSGEPSKSDAQEIAKLLARRKTSFHPTVLFLGSRAGGLFRSQALLDSMQGFSRHNLTTLPQQDMFTQSYQFLSGLQSGESELHSHLKSFLRDVACSEADRYLAELIRQRLFSIIVSTNIDDLLEQALSKTGMRKPFDFDIVLPENADDLELDYSEPRLYCRIIKPFGDLATRPYKLVKRNGYLDGNARFKKLLEDTLARDILVVGLDATWDEEIIRAFLPKANSLWFVNEETLLDHPLISRIFQGRQQVRYITGPQGAYEAFFKALHSHLISTAPDLSSTEHFVNRVAELKHIDNAFATLFDQDHLLKTRILAFHGIEGIGKTTMLQQIKQRCDREHLPYIHADAQQDIPGFSRTIVEQVHRYQNMHALLNHNGDWLNLSIIATRELLKLGPAVMLVDSLDPAKTEQLKWIETLLKNILLGNKLFVVLTSKRKPIFAQERSVANSVTFLELQPLNRDSCQEYFSTPNLQLEAEVRDAVFEWTHGYPLAMQVMRQSIAAGLDPRKEEDRQGMLADIIEQVINQKVLARPSPDKRAWCHTILRLLSVPRRFSLLIIRRLVERFAPEYRRESGLAYLVIPKEINEATDALPWNVLRAGYAVDPSVRNIFLLELKIQQTEMYYSIHDFLAQINYDSMVETTGLDRIRALREYLYHLVCKKNDADVLEQIQRAIQQTTEGSPETFLHFSEEFMQDEELQEALGTYKNATITFIHTIHDNLPPEG